MATQYAEKQSIGSKNHVENVAVVGVGGRSGSFIAKALINTGKHRVTAITRPDSTGKLPEGIHDVKHVNYDSRTSIADALKGQDVLIITMSRTAPSESQKRLVDAAVEAGVKWILPNDWGVDPLHPSLGRKFAITGHLLDMHDYIEKVGAGKTHWIGATCGFWYEFSLAGTEARYGFDFEKKEVTLYDEGEVKINTSTWSQVGRAIASLLSLKIYPDNEKDESVYLSQWNNQIVYFDSFYVSQRDMLASVLRVTGDQEGDWKISYEDVEKRYERGTKLFQKEGKLVGMGIMLYARMFFKDRAGDYNSKLQNDVLGLPKESLDEATKEAVRMAKAGENNMIH